MSGSKVSIGVGANSGARSSAIEAAADRPSPPIARAVGVAPYLLVAFAAAGCAGSRSYISASSAKYPVSFSPSVRDSSGNILADEELKRVGAFKYEYSTVHMLLTIIPLSENEHDISKAIDEQVAASRGEAIVNFKVTTYKNPWNGFAMLLGLGLLPAYSSVEISGDIVVKNQDAIAKNEGA